MSGWRDWTVGEVVEEPDFQSFVQDQVVQRYANAGARGSALGTAVAEGMVSYLDDTNAMQVYDGSQWIAVGEGDITAVTAGTALTGGGTSGDVTLDVDQSQLFTDGTAGQVVLSNGVSGLKYETGYLLRETLYFTSNSTFTKASYPYLKAIKVKCQGGGGGSGYADASGRVSGGGAGGGYGEKFVTDIAGLSASEAITVGAGGAAGISGAAVGGTGGSSEALGVVANGGTGGQNGNGSFGEATGGTVTGADFSIQGGDGGTRVAGVGSSVFNTPSGGGAFFGVLPPVRVGAVSQNGANGRGFGSGGGGAMNLASVRDGTAGQPGIVILELYA